MKKYLFFFLIAIIIFTSFIFKDRLALGAISKLIHLKDKLGELYIEKLSFELADDEEQIHTGCTEKYVLKASDGTKWLFKSLYNEDEEKQILIAYRLANILGVNTPERYGFNISINGINKRGFLQRMLPPGNSHFSLGYIGYIRNNFIQSVFCNGIFCYLLCIPNDNCEFLVSPSGKIYQIDLNNIFDPFWELLDDDAIARSSAEYLIRIDNSKYLMDISINDIDIDFKQVYTCLKHIQEIDNDWLIKYLEIGPGGYSDSWINSIMNIMIKKKSTLSEDFRNHYSSHPNFHSKDLYSASSFSYRVKICKKLSKDILQRCIDLLFSKRQKIKSELSLISSGNAWRYINNLQDDLHSYLDFSFKNKLSAADIKNQVIKLFLDAENELISIRYDCDDFGEKLAITLYLRQVRTVKKYIEKYYTDKSVFVDLLHIWNLSIQIVQNVHTFKHPSSTDQWFSFIKYQTKGIVPIVKLKGEDEYIMGLINLISKRYNEAMQHLATAQKEGYAVDYEFNK
ncbi:MAG: hypothetical protein ISS47_04840 [Candidatus Omnitrophica bacterium]|nr:hypothetical protein [Candidatus Omnitrophota bacterium]